MADNDIRILTEPERYTTAIKYQEKKKTYLWLKVKCEGDDKNHEKKFVEQLEVVAGDEECYCMIMGLVDSPCSGKGKLIKEEHYEKLSDEMGVEKNVFKAVAKVESGGRNSFISKEPQLSKILYERHKAYKHAKKLRGKVKADELQTSNDNLFNINTGGYKGGAKEHERLNDAVKLLDNDRSSPIMSASWGKFQVLGEYYKHLYKTPEDLEKAQNMCEIQQFRYFRAFLEDEKPKIIPAMKTKDWATIAKLYNGKYYAKNEYDIKMKKAYDEYNK